MKTKLRKEFEAFKLESQQQIWELQNPPKFKFGDKLYLRGKEKCICKGRPEIENLSWSKNPYFDRTYLIEIQCKGKKQNYITRESESDLFKRKKNKCNGKS